MLPEDIVYIIVKGEECSLSRIATTLLFVVYSVPELGKLKRVSVFKKRYRSTRK